MATSTTNRKIAAWKKYVKLNVCLQDWKKDVFLTIFNTYTDQVTGIF